MERLARRTNVLYNKNITNYVMSKQTYEERKTKLLNYFRKFKEIPSYDEMLELFDLSSKGSLYKYVQKFIEEGVLEKGSTGKLIPTSKLYGIRKLGSVQAGFPSPAEEELVDTMSLDEWLIEHPEASYMLNVQGDSMIDAGIVEGDMVIVDRTRKPDVGDIVVALVDGDWTMKYFMKKGNKTYLRAANRRYPDIHPEEELQIGGVVSTVIRKY